MEPNAPDGNSRPSDSAILGLLTRVGMALGVVVEPSDVVRGAEERVDEQDSLAWFFASAEHAGIFVKEVAFSGVADAYAFLDDGYPLIVAHRSGDFTIVEPTSGATFELTTLSDGLTQKTVRARGLGNLLTEEGARVLVAKRELECETIASALNAGGAGHGGHEHLPPLKRFIALLDLDRRDILTVGLFAFVSGVLTLATPLAVEALVNVVSWGIYLQPIIVLGGMLLACLAIAGFLRLLQTVVVELVQRRQFVRIVSDLAHRFPRASRHGLEGHYPRELANRVFDIMTIQKATAVLLLDGVSIVLTTAIGLVLLAFYHPFLLGFDLVLVLAMISVTWMLGRGGISTAIEESITKYRVAHWLQDVLSFPSAFKTGGGEGLAIQRANQLTAQYLQARRRQFRVIVRQVAFAITLQVVASTVLLALGGWLVIEGQLTLGQLVASELVVTVVVGAFAKAGKSLEKFYDLMAGIDKVGHLIDLVVDPRHRIGELEDAPVNLRWTQLEFSSNVTGETVEPNEVEPGSKVLITGSDLAGRDALTESIAGLRTPDRGVVQVGEVDSLHAATTYGGALIGFAGTNDVFHASVRENIDLGRAGIGSAKVRETLARVGLTDTLLKLPNGLEAKLQTGGHPLAEHEVARLMIARAIIGNPKLLVIDRTLDRVSDRDRQQIIELLTNDAAPWTLIVSTDRDDLGNEFDRVIELGPSPAMPEGAKA